MYILTRKSDQLFNAIGIIWNFYILMSFVLDGRNNFDYLDLFFRFDFFFDDFCGAAGLEIFWAICESSFLI